MTVTRTLTTVVVTLALSGIANAQTPPEATRETWKAGEEATALNSMSVINLRTGYCGGDMTEGSQKRKNIKFIGCVMYVLGVVDMLREWQKLDPTHALPVCVPRSVDAGRLIVVVHDYIEATAPWRQQQLDATTSVIGALKATWPCPGARR
jgi:Rap1a immunity proteins